MSAQEKKENAKRRWLLERVSNIPPPFTYYYISGVGRGAILSRHPDLTASTPPRRDNKREMGDPHCTVYGKRTSLGVLVGLGGKSDRPKLDRSLSDHLPRTASSSSLKNAGDPEVGGRHRTDKTGRQRLRSGWQRWQFFVCKADTDKVVTGHQIFLHLHLCTFFCHSPNCWKNNLSVKHT